MSTFIRIWRCNCSIDYFSEISYGSMNQDKYHFVVIVYLQYSIIASATKEDSQVLEYSLPTLIQTLLKRKLTKHYSCFNFLDE